MKTILGFLLLTAISSSALALECKANKTGAMDFVQLPSVADSKVPRVAASIDNRDMEAFVVDSTLVMAIRNGSLQATTTVDGFKDQVQVVLLSEDGQYKLICK